jgi:hypothetical protein
MVKIIHFVNINITLVVIFMIYEKKNYLHHLSFNIRHQVECHLKIQSVDTEKSAPNSRDPIQHVV